MFSLPLACCPSCALNLQVKKPPRRTILLMKAVAAVMLVVALLAIVGSAQNIIVSWSSYTFFS